MLIYNCDGSERDHREQSRWRIYGTTSAVVLHKRTEQVKPRNDGKWEFSRALLPGQGWYVYLGWSGEKMRRTREANQRRHLGEAARHAGQEGRLRSLRPKLVKLYDDTVKHCGTSK